jgi:hypothetical protein
MALNTVSKDLLINIHLEDCIQSIAKAERCTGIELDVDWLINEALQCVYDRSTARAELEMCATGIVEDNSLLCNDAECDVVFGLFMSIGNSLVDQLNHFGLYKGNKLWFLLNHRVLNNLVFIQINSDNIRMLNGESPASFNRHKRV